MRWLLGLGVAVALTLGCGQAQTYEGLDLNSSGSLERSAEVRVDGPWDLRYAYDCTAHNSSGGFTVTVLNQSDDSLLADDPDTIVTDAAPGTSKKNVIIHYPHGGDFYFRVSSHCSWRIQVRFQGSA